MAELNPVVLSVARIRQELQQGAGAGLPVTPLLGQIFHETFAELMGSDSRLSWQALSPAELRDEAKLREHVYVNLVGPRLYRQVAALQKSSAAVLTFWTAVREMCEWTRAMLEAAAARNLIEYDAAASTWRGATHLVTTEKELCWNLQQPEWSRPVRVAGIADAIWRKPETGEWCVVEYKLGRTSPEADLSQACLYHQMLGGNGSLALLRFLPEQREAFFAPERLEQAREPLIRLIGALAGVANGSEPIVAAPPAVDEEHASLGRDLLKVLEEFGSPARIDGTPIVGPTFMRYVLEPARRISVKGILKLAADLQVRLRLDAAPVIHVDKGRLVVDLQRKDRQIVPFSSIRSQLPELDPSFGSSLTPVGVDLAGKLKFADLSNAVNAHILVAGSTGSGKSEWMRSALAGLLLTNTPDTLRLVLIDPKRNAFGELKGSPFLYRPDSMVYPPEHSAVAALEALVEEMETRYRAFEAHGGADDLERYARKSGHRLPRIVCVCDEYADLVSGSKAERAEIEGLIKRLGAKARAAGIHLILATQRPSRDTVTGTLKANMSCKVGLKTQAAIESRLILGEAGAENLLGHGDLLFSDIGKPVRLQSPYLPEEERIEIFGASRNPA